MSVRKVMTPERAAELLHVPLGAMPAEVQSAFKAQVMVTHPDHGGSAELYRATLAARAALLAQKPEPKPATLAPPAPARETAPIVRPAQGSTPWVALATFAVLLGLGAWACWPASAVAPTDAPPVPHAAPWWTAPGWMVVAVIGVLVVMPRLCGMGGSSGGGGGRRGGSARALGSGKSRGMIGRGR